MRKRDVREHHPPPENPQDVILRAKLRVYRISLLLTAFACLVPIVILLTRPTKYVMAHVLINGAAILMTILGQVLLRGPAGVRLVERLLTGSALVYVLVWDVLNLWYTRIPTADEVVGNGPVFILVCILLSLSVPVGLLTRVLFGLFAFHAALTWANLLQLQWSGVHNAQITTDMITLVAIVMLTLIGIYHRQVALSTQHALDLREMALTDPLTGLANRRAVYDHLDEHYVGGVLLLDVDDFKQINDDQGHQRGDEVLAEIALHLARALQNWPVDAEPAPILARWGGEEFIVVLGECSTAEATDLAESIRRHVAEARITPGLGLSVGVTTRRPEESVRETLARADRLMYLAKHTGKNRVQSSL